MAEFQFDTAALTDALESAGYDVDPPASGGAADPAVVSARRDGVAGGVAVIVIDRGGRLRLTLTRDTAPERTRDRVVKGQRVRLVDTTTRTTTAVLSLGATTDLPGLLTEIEHAAAS